MRLMFARALTVALAVLGGAARDGAFRSSSSLKRVPRPAQPTIADRAPDRP